MNPDNVHCFGTIFPNLNFVFASICVARPVHIQSDQYRSCSTVNNVTTRSRHSSRWGATKNSAVALSLRNNMMSIDQRSARTNEGKTTLIWSYSRAVCHEWFHHFRHHVHDGHWTGEFATVIWRLHCFTVSFCGESAENPAPDNSPQSIGELRNGHVANLQELYYTRLDRKMAWYKFLIHVLIVQFLRITMCFPYWWCTKHAQLIMGTWSINKKHFLQLI